MTYSLSLAELRERQASTFEPHEAVAIAQEFIRDP